MYIIKLASLITIIYSTLNGTLERNKYPLNFKNKYIKESTHKNTYKKLEHNKRSLFRKKAWVDIEYHKKKENYNKESSTQILINKEKISFMN